MDLEISYETLKFHGTENFVRAVFYRNFYFDIERKKIEKIGQFKINESKIIFGFEDAGLNENEKDQLKKRVQNSFSELISAGFQNLKNSLNNKPTVYVHQNSGIPLIGTTFFGLVDRNSSLIEIKPITSCNIKCIYCSVDEDKREIDFVVEKDYLIQELKRLVEFKDQEGLELHINTQGEPLLYSEIEDMIKDASKIKKISKISIDTNGSLLTKKKVDLLIEAGLTQFNISLNAIDDQIARQIANSEYDVKRVIEICRYIASKGNLLLAPVMMKGINEEEMPKIIDLAKELGCPVGIQNFLRYKFGRNPCKELKMNKFYDFLKTLEEEKGIKLILSGKDFKITKTKPLPKPFKKGQIITAFPVCKGRMDNEIIFSSENRCIIATGINEKSVRSQEPTRIKITRDKHNIFYGEKTK